MYLLYAEFPVTGFTVSLPDKSAELNSGFVNWSLQSTKIEIAVIVNAIETF